MKTAAKEKECGNDNFIFKNCVEKICKNIHEKYETKYKDCKCYPEYITLKEKSNSNT